MNNNKFYFIDSFPKDNKLRVVWAYGAVYKNIGKTRVPEICIMLKEIEPNGQLSNKQIFRKVSVAQLDTVRYMTIWKGNKKTKHNWKSFDGYYAENKLFSFDTTTASSMTFIEKRPNFQYSYFPPYRYKFDHIDNKIDYYSFANATFTKFETADGITVVVPSMELLTSTYVPQEQKIRYKLIQHRLDDVLDKYIKSSRADGEKYKIELYESKIETNISFLAYAKFNKISRQRLQKLRASIETGSQYPERYPIVLPYHPSNLDLQGDGIWLDKGIFFMFRINNYSLPIDNEIESYAEEMKFKIDKSKQKNKSYGRIAQDINDYEVSFTNKHNPHRKNASLHMVSEVGVLNPCNGSIKHKKCKLNILVNSERDIGIENIEDIDSISSAQSDQTNDSNKTGGIKFGKHNKTHLKQSEVLTMVIESLKYLRDNYIDLSNDGSNVYVENILFVGEECELYTEQTGTQFFSVLKKAKKETNSWVKKKKIEDGKTIFLGYRNYMLIKIILNNGTYIYLFEIDRKPNDNGYLGMMFSVVGEISKELLVNLLCQVMDKRGVVKKVKLSGLAPITFRHKTNKENNLNNTITRYIRESYMKFQFMGAV